MWCTGISAGRAVANYESEIEAQQVWTQLKHIMIDGKLVQSYISKENKKQLKLKDLDPTTDEESLQEYLQGTLGKPQIFVYREENKSQLVETKPTESDTFNQLLLDNDLDFLIMRMTVTQSKNQKFQTRALIPLNNKEEALMFVNKYDGKTGIVGPQKLRLKIISGKIIAVSHSKIFKILKNEFYTIKAVNQAEYPKTIIEIEQDKIVINGPDGNNKMKIAFEFDKLIKGTTLIVNQAFLNQNPDFFKDAISDLKEKVFIKRQGPNSIQIIGNKEDQEICYKHIQKQNENFMSKRAKSKKKITQIMKEEKLCGICYDDQNVYYLSCGELFCIDCLQEHVSTTQKYKVICPGSCSQLISMLDLQQIFSQEDFATLCQQGILSFINANSMKIKNCLTTNCPQIFEWNSKQENFQCQVCNEKWCIKNLSLEKPHRSHPGKTCQQFEYEGQIGLKEFLAQGIVKKCPFCQTPIFKDGGCNHVTCYACKGHFCWKCGDGFQTAGETYAHLTANHGGYY